MRRNKHLWGLRQLITALIGLVSLILPIGVVSAMATEDNRDSKESQTTTEEPQSSEIQQKLSGEVAGDLIGGIARQLNGAQPFSVIGRIEGPYSEQLNIGGTGIDMTPSYWFFDQTGTPHALSGNDIVRNGQKTRQWCVNLLEDWPLGDGEPNVPSAPLNHANVPSQYRISSNAEMAYILRTYGTTGQFSNSPTNDAAVYAAVALLVHTNYETGAAVHLLDDLIDTLRAGGAGASKVADYAAGIANDARDKGADLSYAGGLQMRMDGNHRDFKLDQIGVWMGAGSFEGGYDVVVTVEGPAQLDTNGLPGGVLSADGKTWKGTTLTGKALKLTGSATANGLVSAKVSYPKVPQDGVLIIERPAGAQTTLMRHSGETSLSKETEKFEAIVDFQPMLTSSTEGAESKVVSSDAATLKDQLTVFADPNYENQLWMGVGRTLPEDNGYVPLPVKFTGTLYSVGETPIGESEKVPGEAQKIAETTFVANGPGTYEVEVPYNGDPGFITWVWKVSKEDQPLLSADEAAMIHSDWSDGYGVSSEQTSVQWKGKIESNLKVHPTNDNTFLVDDVWISEMPTAHGLFKGSMGFNADLSDMEARLYFWEGKTANQITTIEDAHLVGTVEMEAKSGFFASQGSTDWKLQRDSEGNLRLGTYQVVHVFDGDDRVAPFMSQIPDAHEIYEVTGEPQIGTTASGELGNMVGAFEEAKVTDEVCYLQLLPGKEYELEGVLMNRLTGEPLLSDGKEIRSSKTFTPESPEGCETLEFSFDASLMAGTTTVVFEDLYQDGVKVATHTDIDDRGQTVEIPKVTTTATTPDRGKEIEPDTDQAVVDRVCYSKLTPGKQYQLEGVLMDKTTHKQLLIDGRGVETTQAFIAETSDGCTELEFRFDATNLSNHKLVVFEELFVDGVKIASHADFEDEGQTVEVRGENLPNTGARALGTVALGCLLGAAGLSMFAIGRRRSL